MAKQIRQIESKGAKSVLLRSWQDAPAQVCTEFQNQFRIFQFLKVNSEVSKFSISHNQYRIFQFSNFSKPVLFIFHFFSSISMQSCRRAPWYGEHEHERGSSQFEPQHRRRHEERLQDEQP